MKGITPKQAMITGVDKVYQLTLAEKNFLETVQKALELKTGENLSTKVYPSKKHFKTLTSESINMIVLLEEIQKLSLRMGGNSVGIK